MELNVTSANFQQTVLQSAGPVIVDFWAPWCGPCKMQGPIFEDAAQKFGNRATFVKVNVQDEPGLAQQFGVSSIPCIAVFQNGRLLSKEVGVHDLGRLEKLIP